MKRSTANRRSKCVRHGLWLSLRLVAVWAVLALLCGAVAGLWVLVVVTSLMWLLTAS